MASVATYLFYYDVEYRNLDHSSCVNVRSISLPVELRRHLGHLAKIIQNMGREAEIVTATFVKFILCVMMKLKIGEVMFSEADSFTSDITLLYIFDQIFDSREYFSVLLSATTGISTTMIFPYNKPTFSIFPLCDIIIL